LLVQYYQKILNGKRLIIKLRKSSSSKLFCNNRISKVVPVEVDMIKYISYMKSIVQNENDIDLLPCPLTFYSTGNYGGDNLPILSRIASVIFPCSPASGDVERTSSSTGKVLSPSRQSLLPSTVSSIVFLKGVYKEEERRPTHREKVAKKNFQKFVAFMGKSFFISRRDKKESADFLILLIVSANGSVQKTVLILKRT
jgi:hypothetical protein